MEVCTLGYLHTTSYNLLRTTIDVYNTITSKKRLNIGGFLFALFYLSRQRKHVLGGEKKQMRSPQDSEEEHLFFPNVYIYSSTVSALGRGELRMDGMGAMDGGEVKGW